MLQAEGIQGGFLEYKGRPLVRQGTEIYYGDLADKYHVFMMIMSDRKVEGDKSIPDKIMVQLLKKDGSLEKQTFSAGFSDALETAEAWLERYNK